MKKPQDLHQEKPLPQGKKQHSVADLCVNPEARVCPLFDATGIATYPVGDPHKMGFPVVDNCTWEHIQ